MRSVVLLRRVLRHALHRRTKQSARLSAGPVLLSALLILTVLLFTRPSFLAASEPLTVVLRTHSLQFPANPWRQPAPTHYEPLRSRVDAIVGASRDPRLGLQGVYALPSPVVQNMTHHVAARLYWKLVYADVVQALRASYSQPREARAPPFRAAARVLFVHAQNGLGNRLRALASGLAIARATGRVPVVVWERDPHLGASFDELFETGAFGSDIQTILYRDLIVMDSFPQWPVVAAARPQWRPVSYMVKDGGGTTNKLMRFPTQVGNGFWTEPANFMDSMGGIAAMEAPSAGKPIVAMRSASAAPSRQGDRIEQDVHLYFKSAYVAVTEPKTLSEPQHVNRELMELRPSKAVMDVANTVDRKALQNSMGVHIRSRTLENDNVAVDINCEYTTEGARTTNFWRSQSQVPVFIERMNRIVKDMREKNLKFFVAADDVQVLKQLEASFPGQILSLPRSCDDRNGSCIIYAMADLFCLSRTRKIYGSQWSSFTEAAARLGGKTIELSGVNFGQKSPFSRLRLWAILERITKLFPWRHFPKTSSPFTNCIHLK